MTPYLLHQFIAEHAASTPDATALLHKKTTISYAELWRSVERTAAGLQQLGLKTNQRVAVYLPKQPETVVSFFATSAANGVFVPVNPILKPEQVQHILNDCDVSILITSRTRAKQLTPILANCPALKQLILVDPKDETFEVAHQSAFAELGECDAQLSSSRIDADLAAILYTSGSTGRPKGVVLSHANMVAGARSVAQYLENTAADRLLAVLPFSFDYGLSQLTTAFSVGASVALMDYLMPRDVIRAVVKFEITGLAAVPPLWNQLCGLEWPEEAAQTLRYITNSGGAMPRSTTQVLQQSLPNTEAYLMYGLTEAFRSTYLPPDQVAIRPESMGIAIPNAEVMVVRPDGSECDANEPGELVHRGILVAQGYWNDPQKTEARFRPAPGQPEGIVAPEIAVWSGDQVKKDAEGYLYFVGRKDEMIKTSGYRVSPGEIEEAVLTLDTVEQAVAMGAKHDVLGQAIVLILQGSCSEEDIVAHCKEHLPQYMLPARIEILDDLPRNANGKIDRSSLSNTYKNCLMD